MPNQEKILELVRSEPRSLYELSELLNVHPMSLDLNRMEALGMIRQDRADPDGQFCTLRILC